MGVVGFTYVAMLDTILVTNASKCANHATTALGWSRVDLVVNLLLATSFIFYPLPDSRDFLAFPV
jgi:hypothetical protein